MSINAPDWFRPQYESRAMHIYQTEGHRLRSTIEMATSFNDSNEAVFYLAGKTVARKIDRNTSPAPGGGERKKFTAPLYTWQAFDEIKQFDLDRLALPEREIIYQAGALALGRATDKEVYDVMYAAKTSVAAEFDFSAGAFTAVQAMALARQVRIETKGKSAKGDVYCGLPSLAFDQLLAHKQVYNAPPISQGFEAFNQPVESRYWRGVHWFELIEEDDQDFFRIPDSNKCDAFIWHKGAMGWGNKEDLTVIPQWDNRGEGGGCWTINMQAKGCATTLQEGNGVVRFRLSTNSAVAFT